MSHTPLSQAFRLSPTAESVAPSTIIRIATRLDPRTAEHIVLWQDILDVFEHAKYLMNGETAVSFMVDDSFNRLLPLRIAYQSDVALDVVVDSLPTQAQLPAYSDSMAAAGTGPMTRTLSGTTDDNQSVLSHHSSLCRHKDDEALAEEIQSLAILSAPDTQDESTDNGLTILSTNMTASIRLSLHSYNQLYGSYFQAIMKGQIAQAVEIKDSMKEHFGSLQSEMDKNKALQEKMLGMQEEIVHMQKQALDRLAILQTQIQSIITQTYELHEYPIPRLFIILPRTTRRRDRLGRPFSMQFRLFFLCECGSHTMSDDSKIPHEIHLAKHEGYDLEKPTEFFEKYGPYVLMMMQMIKYGFTAAGIIVPPLASLKLVEGMDAVQRSLDLSKYSIGTLVDETINFIQGTTKGPDLAVDGHTDDRSELERLEALEGADLRQLESYLRITDSGRVLGNLYRIVTSEGHVKWVCLDHYRESYRESLTQQLRDVVLVNNGLYVEQEGKINIRIASKVMGLQFYEALVKAKRTQELVIKLDWDATLDDLRTFASAVAKANIISLTVDGWAFKGPALDVVNRSRRYDPILQLISNGRLQMMYLKSFEDFYQRISSTAARIAPHLRVLSIGSWLSASSSTSMAALSRIIECCPSLQELTLSCQSIPGVFGTIMERACRMQKLKTLTLASPGPTLKVRFSYGKDCAIEAEVSSLHALSPEEQDFLQKGHLTKLSVKHALKPTDPEAPLAWILFGNLHLSEVELVCAPERFPGLIGLMTETRARLLGTRGAVSSCRLQLRNSVWDSLEQKNRLGMDGAVDRVSMVVTYAEAETPADIRTDVVMGFTLPEIGCDMTSILMLYGWSIERLTTNRMFNDTHAALLEVSTAKLGCKMVDVLMDPTALGPAGVSSVNRILGRAENLKRFILHFGSLEDIMQQKKAVKLLRGHGTRMTGLSLIVGSERSWLNSVEELFSSRERENWRRLNTLRVIGRKNDIEIPEACARWITEVISRPNNGEEAALGLEVSMIQELVLERVRFREQDWRRILQSVDMTFMRTLNLANTNFGRAEFELLCERNAPKKEGGDVLLESLQLAGTDIALAVDFLGETAFKSLKARFEKETRAVVVH
ncbi:hypothetical protein BGZ67_009830 [Mortierella alpina]|nr:hypothetical protein BGZ67_009830 [Mortierella alpina]